MNTFSASPDYQEINMIKIIFLFIVIIHGLIHLMGFMKAFKLAEISQLIQRISRPSGILWLFSTLLFLAVAVLLLLKKEEWWMLAIVAIIASQILIVFSWQDAKYGTIPNIIILAAIILGFAVWNFNMQINREINTILSQSKVTEKTVITKQMLDSLPLPVQKWLNNSGIAGKEKIQSVYLKQTGLMKLKPEQKEWSKVEAEQYITTYKPAFLWKVDMPMMMSLVNIAGRDLFIDGQGEMQIRIASFISVVNASNNEKLNQAALQRYLAELVWYPSAAVSSYIIWESIDDRSAKATMIYKGVSGSVIFYFNEQGDTVKISAQRYKDIDENAQPKEWIGEVKENSIINGVKIPTQIDISWVLDGEVFTWYKLKISDVEYHYK